MKYIRQLFFDERVVTEDALHENALDRRCFTRKCFGPKMLYTKALWTEDATVFNRKDYNHTYSATLNIHFLDIFCSRYG